ncbi:MAG TPA: hypothetical protein VI522_08135, partial [Gammaproteobacteria bacterium]|nr:hypothetical protein [Gammaproteobacteria bacterium]
LPALGFIKMAVSRFDATLTYREMLRRLLWVELAEIAKFSAMLARRLALAQKVQIVAGINRAEQSSWKKIEDQCHLLAEELKSGEKLSDGEQRALLEAKVIFEYMFSHDKPNDMTLSGRVNLLIQQIVGAQYVYKALKINPVQQSTSSAAVLAAPLIPGFSSVGKENFDQVRQELAALKLAQKEEQKNKQEQAQQLQVLQQQLVELQKHSVLSRASVSHIDNGNGTLTTQHSLMIDTLSGPIPLTTLIISMQKRIAELENGLATVNPVVAQLQEAQKGTSKRKPEVLNEHMRSHLLTGGPAYKKAGLDTFG